MKELKLIEMMGSVDEELLLRANAPVPLFRKPRFRIAVSVAAVAMLLVLTMVASPVAVAVSYGNAHPEIEGGLVYVMDAMIKDEDHFLSSLLPEDVKNTLGSVFDALKGEKDKNEGGNESESESESENESEMEIPPASEGLLYDKLEFPDQTVYFVVGIGTCTDTVVVIPSTYNGLPVFSINESAFYNCDWITEIYVGEGVKTIGTSAFSKCTSLTSIHLPSTITDIDDSNGKNPFRDCTLENIYLSGENANLKLVNHSLLYHEIHSGWKLIAATSQSTSITPADLNAAGISTYTISPYAFSNRRNIKEFIVESTGATDIFENCIDLETVTLQNVPMIRSKNFANCPSLHTVYIPDTVTYIESLAFENCTSLREIRFGGTVVQWQKIEKMQDWDLNAGNYTVYCTDGTFGNVVSDDSDIEFAFELNEDGQGYTLTQLLGTNTDKLTLPSSHKGLPVTAIANSAFFGMVDIVEVTVPDSITVIGNRAFMDCTSLKTVTLPTQMQEIGTNAFKGCTALERIVIPEGITEIPNYCFENCSSLQEVLLPSSLIRIKKYGFSNCHALKEISLPDGMSAIGTYAFSNCIGLESVVLPNSITTIDTYAFSSCSNLKSIDLPDSLNTISEGTFHFCFSLTEVVMHEGLGLICKDAFSHCRSLVHMQFPENLKTVQENAFFGCEKLESLYFGAKLTKLEKNAFKDCKALVSITYNGTQEQFREACEVNWISGIYQDITYTYLAETVTE